MNICWISLLVLEVCLCAISVYVCTNMCVCVCLSGMSVSEVIVWFFVFFRNLLIEWLWVKSKEICFLGRWLIPSGSGTLSRKIPTYCLAVSRHFTRDEVTFLRWAHRLTQPSFAKSVANSVKSKSVFKNHNSE